MIAAALLSAVWLSLFTRLDTPRERWHALLGSLLFVAGALMMAVALSPGPLGSVVLEESARWAAVVIAVSGRGRGRVVAALCVGVSLGIAEAVLASFVAASPVTDAARVLVTVGLHAPLAVWFCGDPSRSWFWLPAAVMAHAVWNGFVFEQDALALSATAAALGTLALVAARDAHRQPPVSAKAEPPAGATAAA